MTSLIRADSSNPHFISLVALLDAYLAEKDGKEHDFYHQFNSIDALKNVVVCMEDNVPIACGAIKKFDDESMEVKRMFCKLEARGKGFASLVLQELEKWSLELGFSNCVLETGKRQEEAVNFYKRRGYSFIPNYGQYSGIENSLCFKKTLE